MVLNSLSFCLPVKLLISPSYLNEIRNTLEATNSRTSEAEDRISEIEDRMVEINQSERKKEKLIKRMRTISETSRTILNAPTFES